MLSGRNDPKIREEMTPHPPGGVVCESGADPGLILRKCYVAAKVRSSLRWSLSCESDTLSCESCESGLGSAPADVRRPKFSPAASRRPTTSRANDHGLMHDFDVISSQNAWFDG